MGDLFDIEIEPEVRLWLMNLCDADYARAEHAAARLSEGAATLGEPHARYLGDGVRELRFEMGKNRDAIRISYWLAPGRRAVLLTVFRKTQRRESAEVERAKRVKAICAAEHGRAHEDYTRSIEEGENC
ncbi:type II toxin-antitoxin system RelE/ParE family toxin [Streptomyces sp. NPDC020681]|uniref:type II toxin-antitoxin system RelE/ParE family toxin n=1 Tax=Streptomyces sp. NPDC020681 TaxID=3365083 RepID=UPI00378D75D6